MLYGRCSRAMRQNERLPNVNSSRPTRSSHSTAKITAQSSQKLPGGCGDRKQAIGVVLRPPVAVIGKGHISLGAFAGGNLCFLKLSDNSLESEVSLNWCKIHFTFQAIRM